MERKGEFFEAKALRLEGASDFRLASRLKIKET